MNLPPHLSPLLTFQSYAPPPAIHDVVVMPLKKHRALEGGFTEHLRLTDAHVEGLPVPFELRQLSVSTVAPHRLNAFHIHPRKVQDELWSVIHGTLKVWLVDLRETSPTFGVQQCVVLSGEAPANLYIPSGVAHGFKSGAAGATLLYGMSSQFDMADPNEGRLPWDCFGAHLWEEDRG